MTTKSVYIHIPFCKKKCKYCSFVSFERLEMKNIYIDSLLREIKEFYDKTKLKTLYIGGGTPSVLSIGDFENVLSCFNFEEKPEITVEVNPESVSFEYLKELKEIGINRLSIGFQTFNDDILKKIGRIHTSFQALETVSLARKCGFENINIDLMYGLPNQNLKMWEDDLKRAHKLDISHLSLYGLKIDKGCYFYNNRPEFLADADIQADMYLKACEIFSDFYHYEVSNFAKNKNFIGRHNLNYWDLGSYWGFGAASSGFVNGLRYSNVNNIEEYIKNPLKEKKFEHTNLLDEKIFLGLRKLDGLDVSEINAQFNIDFEKKYEKQLNKFKTHIAKTEKGYKLTIDGILVSNLILCEFLED